MSRKINSIIDSVLIIFGILVFGIVGLYWKVLALEVSYLLDSDTQIADYTVVTTNIRSVFKRENIDVASKSKELEEMVLSRLGGSVFAHSLERDLRYQTKKFDAEFMAVPPGRYLRIPRLGIETPVVDVPFASPEKIESGDFDEELKQGIVKYPFTAKPGEIGNTLLFGHSSVDVFEKSDNPFGFVFYALPKLEAGDSIELIWDGTLYEYKVENKQIKRPSQVPDELNKKYDNHQLTLMACYPLMSDAKRILVHTQLVSVNGIPVGS